MRHDGGCTAFIFLGGGGGEELRESCESDGSVEG